MWKKNTTLQSKLSRNLKDVNIKNLTKKYDYDEGVIALVNNCIPMGRLIKHALQKPETQICPFCPYGVLDNENHVYRCPSVIGYFVCGDNYRKDYINLTIKDIIQQLPRNSKIHKRLLTNLVKANLVWCFLQLDIMSRIVSRFKYLIKFFESLPTNTLVVEINFIKKILQTVNSTNIIVDEYSQVPDNVSSWHIPGMSESPEWTVR